MTDSSEWELSKENVQPLREGRRIAALTSALQHTPTDLQHLKEQRNLFEQQLRMYDGDDPLDIWDSYIKWTEQNFPRGGKDGKLLELLQRCVTHFQGHEGYKNDYRFVHIWIKFACFSDEPVEIYQYMFDQKIGCDLAMLYEEWASFVERLGNTRKADSIYLEGIKRGAQPLDTLRTRHSEFQMRVARGIVLQPREEEEAAQLIEEQRTVLGGLRPDKKCRVGTTRTGTAKLGRAYRMGGPAPSVQQVPAPGFQMFQDENAPVVSNPQQTGEKRALPVRDRINSENEQVPGVWTKAKVPQRRAVTAAAAVPAKPTFQIHEDENARQDHHTVSVDNHVLSTRKNDKPGHLLDPVRNSGDSSRNERPMYCKEKVYTGTQEFSFEELRALKYFAKKKKEQDEEERRRLEEQLREMRLIHNQFQMDLQSMRNEHKQLIEIRRQMQLSQDSSGVQPSSTSLAGNGSLSSTLSTPVFGAPVSSAPSSASFTAAPGNAPSFSNAAASTSFNTNAPPSASFTSAAAPGSSGVLSALSSASFSGGMPSVPSSVSFTHPALSSASSFNSSLQRQGVGSHNASLNASQRTPGSNPVDTSSGSGGRQSSRPPSAGRTPDANSSKHSLSSASPTINMKEALQMVQGMYNTSLACDKPEDWTDDTEMTEAVPPPAPQPASIVVFDDNAPKASKPPAVAIFCDENAPPQENRVPPSKSQKIGGLGFGGRKALQERAVVPSPPSEPQPPPPVTHQFTTEDTAIGYDGVEAYQQYDLTLAAVGSQDSFAAAARSASTPFGVDKCSRDQLPSPPLSSIKPPKSGQSRDDEVSEAGIVQTICSEDPHCQTAPYTTFNHTGANAQYLSPIIEGGSSEGSVEEMRSQAASTFGATSALKTPAAPRHAAAAIPKEDLGPVRSDEHHLIDTSNYVPSEPAEATEALLSMSVCIDPHNPFDEASIKGFLKRLSPPLNQRQGYIVCNQLVPSFNVHSFISLGLETYQLIRLIGEGGYAKVYLADSFSSLDTSYDTMDIDPSCGSHFVIKVQKPAAPWEFYICSELHKRMRTKSLEYLRPSMMEITQGYFYQDGSCLVSDYCPKGSLLSLVNLLKKNKSLMASLEPLAAYLTIHLLKIVEALHSCSIIHGDIKPDNILITERLYNFIGRPEVSSSKDKKAYFGPGTQCLRLVDFGQAIDMTLYPPGTTFMAKVGTSGFQCIEMMTDRPWTYQTDMFGVAGTVHVLVFGQYMKVYCSQDQWHMTSSFQRKWNVEVWKKLFHQLLNIKDCDQQPDLVSVRRELEDHFMTNLAPQLQSILVKVKDI